MLVKVDRMSMANSLEVRSPFLDHRVVECAEAMPGAFKVASGEGKRILRRAFADRLPADASRAPKKGFEVPIAAWLTGELGELCRHAIDPARLKRQGLFRPELPQAWYDALKSRRRDTSERLWSLIAFQAWCERFRPGLA
jgi:asparagine synthase (glutamine-hydrolysing)